ncbi:MAG: hypothetical protein JKY94_16885 [Rhodobacteraceae bacterium]|nr:hypothetical protein [Paracoccaceae bacterium]
MKPTKQQTKVMEDYGIPDKWQEPIFGDYLKAGRDVPLERWLTFTLDDKVAPNYFKCMRDIVRQERSKA